MPITAEITYNQFLIDNPTFFDEKLEDGLIDEATVASIAKWFGKRIVCDDFNFDVFFDRQLDLVLPRYNKLIRLENTEFDAMVNAYRERQIVGTGSETQDNSIDKVTNKTDTLDKGTTEQRTLNLTEDIDETKTRTPDLTVQDTKNLTEAKDETTTRTPDLTDNEIYNNVHSQTDYNSYNLDTGKVDELSNSDTSGVAKQNPQSISYQGAAVGEVPALDWQYPSSQTQGTGETHTVTDYQDRMSKHLGTDETTKDGSTTRTHTGEEETVVDGSKVTTGTDTTTTTGEDETILDHTKHNTGTDTKVTSGSDERTIAGTEGITEDKSKTTSDTIREQWTGRDNLTPQEALKSAMNYVKTSSAFAWLKDQLEVCFLTVYDI